MSELVEVLADYWYRWVVQKREDYKRAARPFTADEKKSLLGWFGEDTLNRMRVTTVPVLENPSFYSELKAMEIYNPIDFSQIPSYTFIDIIAVSNRLKPAIQSRQWYSLLFYGTVYGVMYELLGEEDFIYSYVNSWVNNGFSYNRISFEVFASQLQRRFENYPTILFSVADELRDFLGV